jgi:LacI family transcriptional regulator
MRSDTLSTIKEVAKLAGVSLITVSRVINDQPHVRPEMREKVLWAIKALDYRPNAMARGLRVNSSDLLGFVTDNIATTPFAVDIIRGAQDIAEADGKTLLVIDTKGNTATERTVFERMIGWQVEGVIFATEYHRAVEPYHDLRTIPSVLVDCYATDRSLPSVVPNEVQGAHLATETLLQHGHRRIGFINGPSAYPASAGRLQGYKQALAAYDVRFDKRLARSGNWWQESGYAHTQTLMELADPPTAIFCANDWMAMGAYDALKELGRSIPRDVAVVGFDNREVIAAHMRPPLTTIALPYYDMGKWAVEYLIAQAGHEGLSDPLQAKLPCPLIVRESV